MARTKLTTSPWEEGTLKITLSYTDDDGNAVTPNEVFWTLTDKDGTVINEREDVEIETPGTSDDIVIFGDDLALQTGETGSVKRLIYVYGTYDSDAGSDLPLKGECEFFINDLVTVPTAES